MKYVLFKWKLDGWMEIVRSLNKSWIYDTYFSLYRAIHLGVKDREKCPGGNVRIPTITVERETPVGLICNYSVDYKPQTK